jgi:peptidoglycan/xylan/chitin deacetylase (PgdA/CDA1 family)
MKGKRIFLLFILIVCIVIGIIYFNEEKELILNGDSEIILNVNQEYIDEGVNLDDASVDNQLDLTKEGNYTITYTYKDQSVSRIIHVVDTNRIVMNLNGDENTYVKQNDLYIESGCHVIDKNDGNITSEVQITGNVDTTVVGDYTITYSVTHNYLTVQKTRTVHVVSSDNFISNTKGIPVLMYHWVYTKDDVPEKLDSNSILDTKLEEHLKYLKENNYYFPSFKELEAYVNGEISLPSKSVILTFDDGKTNFLKYGIPLLEKYQIPATSFIIGDKDGEKKIKEYASEYISFQSHSYKMHTGGGNIGHGGIISAMSKQEIIDDLKKNAELVQNNDAFAYPYGDVTETAKEAIKECKILCSFTTHYGRVKVGDDLTYLPRVRVLGDASVKSFISTIQ